MQDFRQCAKQLCVLLWLHDAEADVAVIQEGEGGAVADHQALTDAVVEDEVGVDAGF